MRVTETVSLGEKRFVTILHVDGQQLLIGSATGQVTLLAVLDDKQSAGSGMRQSA
jgi:flagellar biogenesis protein FliO